MSSAPVKSTLTLTNAEPAWEIAKLFPAQGHWSMPEYLSLNGNYLVEYVDGCIEVLSLPTELHQLIIAYLYGLLSQFTFKTRLNCCTVLPSR